ncbi:MAG TPA: TIR domain-containing protein [Acidimicrobiales bacterium]|nr:TIR domain-containing protein [Acidimicrobiales bacterium]
MSNGRFDVFLSYNSADRPAVERLAKQLRARRLKCWWDRWELTPGSAWQGEIAEALLDCKACAVIVGPAGLGDWAREELAVAYDRTAKDRSFRTFMVLLPGAPDVSSPDLAFLRMRTWVDLRRGINDHEGMEDLVSAITGAPRRRDVPVADTGTCPYRGLEAFDEAHAQFFFGRDADVARVLEKLKASRFLAVLGPSGSGKSSLLRAGLIPALDRGALPGSERWTRRVATPGPRPLTTLAGHLTALFPGAPMQETLDHLTRDERTLDLAVSVSFAERPHDDRLVLVMDHFEEVFTLCTDDLERSRFIENLVYASTIPGGRLLLVIGMRADFYHRFADFPSLRSLVSDQQFLVGPLGPEELWQTIEEPARRVGLEFEAGLVETIMADVGDRPATLPLLEHLLLELWRERRGTMLTLGAYAAKGRVEGALAQRADATYAGLSPEHQRIARRVLLRLVQPGEGAEDTRRRAEMRELVGRPEEEGEVDAVVKALADARLITVGSDTVSGARVVDIAHEALIRGWPELRTWLSEAREGLRLRRRLSDAAHEWEQAGRDEGHLYRGARLASWREEDTEDLNELERSFLAASFEREARERASSRRRVRVTIGALCVALFTISAFAFVAVVQGNRAADERDIARSRQLAVSARAQLPVDPERGVLLAMEALATKHTPEAEAALRQATLESPVRATLRGHDGTVESVDVSRDGRLAVSAGDDGTVRVWSLESGREQMALTGHEGPVFDAAFSPDGRTVLSAGEDGTVRTWDVATGRQVSALDGHAGPVYTVSFSPDGRLAARTGEDGNVHLWEAATGREVAVLRGHSAPAWGVAFSTDGQRLASGSDDGTVRVWRVTGGGSEVLRGHDGVVQAVAFSPNGRHLASTGTDGTIRVWDLAGGEPVVLRGHIDWTNGVAFSPDGARVVSAGSDGTVRVWTWASTSLPVVLRGHRGAVTGAAFGPGGGDVVSSGADGTVRVWASSRPGERAVFEGHGDTVTGVAFRPDGRFLLTGSFDGTVRVWDRSDGTGRRLGGHDAEVRGVGWSPDGRYAASGGADGTVRVWDFTGSEPPVVLRSSRQTVFAVAFSPDGERVASGGEDGELRVWRWRSGLVLVDRSDQEGRVGALAFGPTGALVSGGEDGVVRLWDGGGDGAFRVVGEHEGAVNSVAFSADGTAVVSTAADGTVRVWDPSGALVSALRGGEGDFWGAAFSPDGQLVVAGGDDGAVRVWKVHGGADPLEFRGHGSILRAVAYSPEGSVVASAGDDGEVHLWDCQLCGASSDRVLDLARTRVTRSLSDEERASFLGDRSGRSGAG